MASRRSGGRKIAETPTLLFGSLFVLWILDAGVQHVLDSESEGLGDDLQFLQSEVTLIQLTFCNPLVDDVTDKVFDFLWVRLLETARGTLHGICQTDNSTLLELRFRAAVPETFLAHIRDILLPNVHDFSAFARILLLLDGPLIKVSDQRCPVMLLDHVNHSLIESILQGKVHALFHVRNADQRAHRRSKIIVWIFIADDVLGEVVRFDQL